MFVAGLNGGRVPTRLSAFECTPIPIYSEARADLSGTKVGVPRGWSCLEAPPPQVENLTPPCFYSRRQYNLNVAVVLTD